MPPPNAPASGGGTPPPPPPVPPPAGPFVTPPTTTISSSPFAAAAAKATPASTPGWANPALRPLPPPPPPSSTSRAHSAQLSGLRGLVAICGGDGRGPGGLGAADAARAAGPDAHHSGRLEIVGAAHPSVSVRRLARAVIRGLRACQDPVALPEGLGGTYVFADEAGRPAALIKPVDEEPLGPNNGKGWSGRALGEPGLKPTVRVGEAAMREVAAFLLDHGGYARVPPTVLVRVQHPIFHVAGRPPPAAAAAAAAAASAAGGLWGRAGGGGGAAGMATPDQPLFGGGGGGGLLASVPSDASTHTSALPGEGGRHHQHTPPTVAGFGAPPPQPPRRPASAALPTVRSGSLPDPSGGSPLRFGGAGTGTARPPARGGAAAAAAAATPVASAATGGLSAALGRVRTGSGDLPSIALAAAAATAAAAAPPPSPPPLPLKLASMAKYVAHDGDASEFGPARFSRAGVVAVGILDLRLCNTDRHAGNILVRRPRGPGEERLRGASGGGDGGPGRPSAEGGGGGGSGCGGAGPVAPAVTGTAAPMDLVPIDHGFCLPEALEPLLLDWLFWAQAAAPFDAEARAYIAALDAAADVALLRRELPSMHVGCLRVLTIGTTLLQRCAAAGLTLSEIGMVASRQSIGIDEEPSELERLCWAARAVALAVKHEEEEEAEAEAEATPAAPTAPINTTTPTLARAATDNQLLVFQLDAMDLVASPDPSPPPAGWNERLLAAAAASADGISPPAGVSPGGLSMAISAPTPARAGAAAGGGGGGGVGGGPPPPLLPPPLHPQPPPPGRQPALHRRSRRDPAPYPPPLAPAAAPGAAVPLADLSPAAWSAFMDAFEQGIAAGLADGRWRAPAGEPAFGGQSCAF